MVQQRLLEISSVGGGVCDEAVGRVRGLACDSCEVVRAAGIGQPVG